MAWRPTRPPSVMDMSNIERFQISLRSTNNKAVNSKAAMPTPDGGVWSIFQAVRSSKISPHKLFPVHARAALAPSSQISQPQSHSSCNVTWRCTALATTCKRNSGLHWQLLCFAGEKGEIRCKQIGVETANTLLTKNLTWVKLVNPSSGGRLLIPTLPSTGINSTSVQARAD